MRFAPVIGFVVVLVLLVAMLGLRIAPTANRQVEAPLPALSLAAYEGKREWRQDTLKGRVTVLNFFASWCTPCAAEMPELAALKKQAPQVRVLGVVWNDEPKPLEAFLAKHGRPFDEIWLDNKGDSTIALGIKGIPETIIVDSKGSIRYRLAGPLTEDLRQQELLPLIEQLQAEAADAR